MGDHTEGAAKFGGRLLPLAARGPLRLLGRSHFTVSSWSSAGRQRATGAPDAVVPAGQGGCRGSWRREPTWELPMPRGLQVGDPPGSSIANWRVLRPATGHTAARQTLTRDREYGQPALGVHSPANPHAPDESSHSTGPRWVIRQRVIFIDRGASDVMSRGRPSHDVGMLPGPEHRPHLRVGAVRRAGNWCKESAARLPSAWDCGS